MREYVLKFENTLYKIGINSNCQLTVLYSVSGQVYSSKILTSHAVKKFSADIDLKGNLHIAVIGNDTLTYIKFSKETSSTTHLMHLPANFEITDVCISVKEKILLAYCVKSMEGYALIEYSFADGKWSGKNIYTSQNALELLCVSKQKGECYLAEKDKNSYMLISAFNPENKIFSGDFPLHYVQLCGGSPIFACGGKIYFCALEIADGSSVYVLDSDRITVDDGEKKIFVCDGTWRYFSKANLPENGCEYILCMPEEDKRILYSKPFPHLSFLTEESISPSILQEVYHQQRTIFTLSAEVKALKARLRKLEDEKAK